MGNEQSKADQLTSRLLTNDSALQVKVLRQVRTLSKDLDRDCLVESNMIPVLLGLVERMGADPANDPRIIEILLFLSRARTKDGLVFGAQAIVDYEGGANALAVLCERTAQEKWLRQLGNVIENCLNYATPGQCAEKGFVRPLAKLIRKTEFDSVYKLAVGLLVQMKSLPRARIDMRATGCMELLVSALKRRQGSGKNLEKVLAELAVRDPEPIQSSTIPQPQPQPRPRPQPPTGQGPIRWRLSEPPVYLGKGAFSTVWQVLMDADGTLVAMKQTPLKEADAEVIRNVQEEIELLQPLCHPNIVRYIGSQLERNTFCTFLEFVPGGSLSSLRQQYGRFSGETIQKYLRQKEGLAYLHGCHIVHRDIKGANILVTNDGVIKLADFGGSRRLLSHADNQTAVSRSMLGTPGYMAPEVFEMKYSDKSDIWSVGATLYYMLVGEAPYAQLTNGRVARAEQCPPPMPPNVTAECRDFLAQCFQYDPQARPPATELLKHAFLNLPPPVEEVGAEVPPDLESDRDTEGQTLSSETARVYECPFCSWQREYTERIQQAFCEHLKECHSEHAEACKNIRVETQAHPSSSAHSRFPAAPSSSASVFSVASHGNGFLRSG